MSNVAVIYKSNYGATKQYAAWIAEELGAHLLEHHTVSPADLIKYDCVVYGGGLYASGIIGVDLVVKNPTKHLVIFTVGLSNPQTTDYSEILSKNLPIKLRETVKVFHLRGSMDYKKLGFVHRGLMAMRKKFTVDKKAEHELTEEDKAFRETYGDKANFLDKDAIAPLIEYVRNNHTLPIGEGK